MEVLLNNLLNPITLIIFGFIAVLGFMTSPYEIVFEDGEDIEI